jgi:hypothetical protein
MRNAHTVDLLSTMNRLLGATLLVSAVAACSSGIPASIAPKTLQHDMQAPTRSTLPTARARMDAAGCPPSVVYIVSSSGGSVEIYDASNLGAGPCGRVAGMNSPQGLFVDSKRDLWVVDASVQQVYEFKPGSSSPVRTLSDPNGVPNDVVVDESSGTAYVTEYQNNVDPHTLVEIYALRSSTPTGSLSDPSARNGGYDTVDNKGNLYVTFMTQDNKARVDRWMGGIGSPHDLRLQFISDGGIVTTSSGSLAICDPFAFRCGSFAPGSKTMSRVFGHMGRGSGGVGPDKPPFLHPDTLALDRDERLAYVAGNSLSTWRFPGPGHRPNHLPLDEIQIPGGAGRGLAVSPAALPGMPYR